MRNIEHVVVVMLENRSFDHLLGWLYADQDNQPPRNIPDTGALPTYDGLIAGAHWNPTNTSFFDPEYPAPPERVYASEGTGGRNIPPASPSLELEHVNFQLFGTRAPQPGQVPSMLGFLVDYGQVSGEQAAASLMRCYSPGEVSVLSGLARSYAVCDRWFSSVPGPAWPNRSFVHAGTSAGRAGNWPYAPSDVKTLYQVLEEHGVSWGIYYDQPIPILKTQAQLQLRQLRDLRLRRRFRPLRTFLAQARSGTLPAYSFLEPSFLHPVNSEHPPHTVRAGERFLFEVWRAVSTGAHWRGTLLVITYAEHGGCFDHVPPPWGATPPDAASDPGEHGFRFDRFGVRVPAVLASPYIEAGTVFRGSTGVPFDHTSILATVRDWLGLPGDALSSRRVRAAPTFGAVLTRSAPRTDLPAIIPALPTLTREPALRAREELLGRLPLADFERGIVAGVEQARLGQEGVDIVEDILARVKTRAQMAEYLRAVAAGAATASSARR